MVQAVTCCSLLTLTMTLLRHKRQQHWHTWGIFKQTLMNVVDNSALGRKAMAEGKPPR